MVTRDDISRWLQQKEDELLYNPDRGAGSSPPLEDWHPVTYAFAYLDGGQWVPFLALPERQGTDFPR